MTDVIVAIATPLGKAGISIVRVSGKESLSICKKMFFPYKKDITFSPNLMTLGKIDLGGYFDKGFMVFFKAPHSYTGEDVVEFHCHGGYFIAQKIVERLLSLGAKMAEPGEFSKRAFLNGKMSLDEAEGVIDSINAETESEFKTSSMLARGKLFEKIKNLQNKIIDIMSEIEVNLDYPEHDIEYQTKQNLKNSLDYVEKELKTLLSTQKQGKIIKNGVNISIVGKPNVGKSMLLNALTGFETAIVTDIEGTTRDVVTSSIEYKGFKFNFLDTAGIRDTKDKIEEIGIEKTKQTIEKSDIVLVLLDSSKDLTPEDEQILSLVKNKNVITVLTKSDLPQKMIFESQDIKISAKNDTNIDSLKEMIYKKAVDTENSSSLILTNSRHIEILDEAVGISQNIILTCMDMSLDMLSLDVRLLYEKLGEITGENTTEEVINRIFSKFCLGK